MRKVLIAFSELFYGGAEKQFRELILRIDKKKFEIVAVVSCAQLGKKQSESVDAFVKGNPNIKFLFLKDISVPKKIGKKIQITQSYKNQLKEILEEEKPDIALAYNGVELSASHLYKKYGVKVIFSERESGNRGFLKLLRYRYFFKSVDKIVCNSQAAKRYYLSKNINASYIPNGIERHELLKNVEDKTVFHIVVPARIARVKNQELIIKAVSHLKEINLKVTLIGKQEDKAYLTYLKKLSDEKNVAERIEFLEFSSDIESIYRKANLIVNPSFMEGFTNVLLESYMFGRICLVSDIPMNRDVANNTQRFFNTTNDEELADLISNIYNLDSSIIEDEVISNHTYVINKFSNDKMIERYEDLFLDLIGD